MMGNIHGAMSMRRSTSGRADLQNDALDNAQIALNADLNTMSIDRRQDIHMVRVS